MPNDSPFLQFKVECPICKTINEFEQIKVGAFTEGGRDTDFCPQDIEWRIAKYQAHNPLLYFTASCSNCFYTREFNHAYRDWKSDNAFRTYRLKAIKERHLEQLSTADSICSSLGQAIDLQRFPNESAIIKLLLAVFDEQLAEHQSNLDLGRFYLRIGWVFRGLNTGENPSQTLLGSLLRDIDSKYQQVVTNTDKANADMAQLEASVRAHFEAEQIPAELQSQMFGFRDRFNDELQNLQQKVNAPTEQLIAFQTMFDEYRTMLLGSGSGDAAMPFGQHPSFADFLLSMRKQWDGIVTGERDAMEKAIHFYKKAFASGREIAPGAQQIQASYLIAELSRRVGDHDGAKQFFTSTIKTGQEFIYQHRRDQSKTQLARKILELAIEQGRANLAAAKPA
ncbi:MAG: DUF2225 domain-containing protein [candidate division Zixibacteria bacterium]|nr:DUF2225 domain-containing protein [candidate division Zixibacteria bacterium]